MASFTLEVRGASGGPMQAAYLEQHQLIHWMQEVLEDLAKEKPDSPWSYIAKKAKQQEEEAAKQLPLLEKLMKLEAEQEERRRELAILLENQGTRQNTPEEAARQHMMKENRQCLEELRFDQMILMEKQLQLQEELLEVPPQASTPQARPAELLPFGSYYRSHVLKAALPSRLYVGFQPDTAVAREAATAAMQVCHPVVRLLRDEDGDSSVAVSAASRARRSASASRERRSNATPSATSGASARSSDSTAATMGGASARGGGTAGASTKTPRVSVPKLVLPKMLQEGCDDDRRPLDSRQRKTREALEKLTALYSVPISRSCPSLFSGKGSGAPHGGEKPPAADEKRMPPRPPVAVPPKERLVNKGATDATRVRSEHALDGRDHRQRKATPESGKLQPLNSNRKKGAYGPSKNELLVRDELGKLLTRSK